MGDILNNKKRTLIDIVAKNISEINNRNKTKKKNNKKIVKNISKNNKRFSISSILINQSINEIKNNEEEKSEEEEPEETIEEEPQDKEETITNGGYGTISKHYGMSPTVKYVNYEKIWGHLGNFRSQSMYEKPMDGVFSQSESKSTGVLVDNRVIEKAERHFKYFVLGDVVGDIGYVPPVGANIDSKDWEKYRLMTQMSIYRPLLALFRAVV